ncbi:MAG: efflux RND transporter periplasmic adaptor subunit [Rhizobiaceae bacterium]
MLDKVGGADLPVADKKLAKRNNDDLEIQTSIEEDVPKRRQPVWLKLFLALVQAVLMVAILFGSYMIAKRMIDDKPEPRQRRAFQTVYTIETVTAQASDYQPVITSYGQTVAERSVALRALVSGEIVRVNPKLRAGARIMREEPLVEIDSFNYEGALAEAEANLAEARAKIIENEAQVSLETSKKLSASEQLDLARADLSRVESLKERQTATQQQVEVRKLVVSQRRQALALAEDTIKVQKARNEQLKASLLRLQWRVEQAKRNLESTVLKAPFTGIVRSTDAEIGRAITANDVVVSMYEAGSLEAKFTLTDAQFGRLETGEEGLIGRKVEVIWSVGGEDWVYPAMIDRIGAEISSTRGGVELFARITDNNNEVSIRPGAFVEVRVPDRIFPNTIVVPDTAIYGTNTVYTAVEGKLVEKTVKVGGYEGEKALISEGLETGDEVLITRITEVSAGLNVIREGETPPRGAARSSKGSQAGRAGQVAEGAARPGPPSPELIAKVAKANNLTPEEFRALPRDKRREMIGAHRASGQ